MILGGRLEIVQEAEARQTCEVERSSKYESTSSLNLRPAKVLKSHLS